jgi:hypothetical protein
VAEKRIASTRLWVIIAAGLAVVVAVVAWAVLRDPGGTTASPGTGDPTAGVSSPTGTGTTGAPSQAPESGQPTKSVPPTKLGTPSQAGRGETVPVKPVKTKEPVPLDKTGDFGTGLSVGLEDIKSVKGAAKAPGEIAGPALKITLQATNDSKKAISLDTVTVAVSYGEDRSPAVELSDGRRPFSGKLGAGDSEKGVYIYTVPTDERDDVRVEVSYTGEAPTVAFEGSVD